MSDEAMTTKEATHLVDKERSVQSLGSSTQVSEILSKAGTLKGALGRNFAFLLICLALTIIGLLFSKDSYAVVAILLSMIGAWIVGQRHGWFNDSGEP